MSFLELWCDELVDSQRILVPEKKRSKEGRERKGGIERERENSFCQRSASISFPACGVTWQRKSFRFFPFYTSLIFFLLSKFIACGWHEEIPRTHRSGNPPFSRLPPATQPHLLSVYLRPLNTFPSNKGSGRNSLRTVRTVQWRAVWVLTRLHVTTLIPWQLSNQADHSALPPVLSLW